MQRRHRSQHFGLRIGRGARGQVFAHAKGELHLRDLHQVAAQGKARAVGNLAFGQQAPGHWPLHPDMGLAGGTGGGDLPADRRAGAIVFDAGLHGIGLCPVAGLHVGRQALATGAGAPMLIEKITSRAALLRVHGAKHR